MRRFRARRPSKQVARALRKEVAGHLCVVCITVARMRQVAHQLGIAGFVSRASRLLRDPVAARDAVVRRLPAMPSMPSMPSGRRRPRRADPPDPTRCLVCGSARTRVRQVERPTRTYEVRVCLRCRYVSNAGNTVDYTAFQSVDRFALTARVGTEERPGREFHMAAMGADILGRSSLRVMVFGAGRSLDYLHIAKLPSVERVIMSDVVDLRGEADFINITKGTSERFDLIIACEVVEHFTDPSREFPRLFDLLTRNGLLVCSTNIYDGGKLDNQKYLYLRGHTSYYSPRAIAEIARGSRMLFDFRLPVFGASSIGRRKRYVLFTRSAKNLAKIAEYFGRHPYAPAESRDVPEPTPMAAATAEVELAEAEGAAGQG